MGGVNGDVQDDGVVEALTTLYRKGWDMEQIAEAMELPLVYVSQVVHALGLGRERYGDRGIPSAGSAPVRRVSAVGSERSARFARYGGR